MQQHPTYDQDTQEQSTKRRRLNSLTPSATINAQCLFCNLAIERSNDAFLEHMEKCLAHLTEGNQLRRSKYRSAAFSKMTTCPVCNKESPFHFKNIRDKARHLTRCLVSNGSTLYNVLDARDNSNAQITAIDLSSPSPPPPCLYEDNNKNDDIDLIILDDGSSLLDPFSSRSLEEFNEMNKRRDSILSDESPSYTHVDSINISQQDNIDLTALDDSPLLDTWSQRQGSIRETRIYHGDDDTIEANDNNKPSSLSPCCQRLNDDTYESNDHQYSRMEDEYLTQSLLDRLCLEQQQFTPSPLFTQLRSCATSMTNDLEARRRSLDAFEKVFFNRHLNLLELSSNDQSTLIQDTSSCLSQTQAKFIYNVIQEMQAKCTAGISWVFEDYSYDGNTLMAIKRLTELDSRLARILCLLDIASHHPMFSYQSTHQDVTKSHDTQPVDDESSIIAVDLTGHSDHSQEIISLPDIVELEFDYEESIQSHSDGIQADEQVDISHGSHSKQQVKGKTKNSCCVGTPPSIHANDNNHLNDNKEDHVIFHCGNLTSRELNFFADTYGLESGSGTQNIALLNRIWKERAHQAISNSDDGNEPISMDGISNGVVRHLKSQPNIWNKMLRYECVGLDDYDGSEDFSSDQIRRELDNHGFLKKSK
ncbi:hypothetical protein K492DRAFT_211071 [Lichtheimia hyalospora FSU 10163]|nr:hypothetical protein K492DRAFT_211071 [Lichtheimia hyalospora FSU 10163]